MQTFGKVVLFGSGETSSTGQKIHRKIFSSMHQKVNIAILETPAGFQPNSHIVAFEIAQMFQKTLGEFIKDVSIIPARKKETQNSPNNQKLLIPLLTSDYIFLGPGSPTYTVRQLNNSSALSILNDRWQHGAALSFSSASAIAMGRYVLPVYEIYKAGQDLHWEKGLDFFASVELPITIITHWNNKEGGKDLDTRFCYMGGKRFRELLSMLPKDQIILGIDEHTAIIFDFQRDQFLVEGKGSVVFIKNHQEIIFQSGYIYGLNELRRGDKKIIKAIKLAVKNAAKNRTSQKQAVSKSHLPNDLTVLLRQRESAKISGNYQKADEIREEFIKKGYTIEDATDGQKVYRESDK